MPSFRLHLLRVAGGGFITGSGSSFVDFFFANPADSDAVFNAISGTLAAQSAGPLRFVSLVGVRTRQVANANISFPTPTPFSPSGKLLLALCTAGQCVLDAATGVTVATIPVLGDTGNPTWVAGHRLVRRQSLPQLDCRDHRS